MALTVYNRPNDRCWSGNPIHYQLFSTAAYADSSIFFEIKINFKRSDASDYTETPVFRYNPVGGYADFDIQNILDSLMDYEVPTVPDDNEFNTPLFSKKITGLFYISFREITLEFPDPEWITSESENACFVIKGGISFEKWRGDNFWVNYFDPAKPFLTWQQSGRLASLGERMYLAFLNLNEIDNGVMKMRRKVTFTDGSVYSFDHDFPAEKYDVVYFPSGAKQLKLDEVYPTKNIWYWTLQVWDTADDIPLSQLFKYELDNKNDYNAVTLNYRNSIAGLDSVRVRGVIEYNMTREFIQQSQVVAHDYFTGGSINGRVKAVGSTEILQYKGDVGFVRKEEQDRLRDIHFRREVWWELKLKWLPVIALTGSQKLKTTDDQRWSMVVEFAIASDGDSYYTPANVDLQEGSLPAILICTAVISNLEYTFDDPGYTVTWDLLSGAPAKYFISTPGVSGGAPHEAVVPHYTFDWLPEGDNLIKVQPICLVNGTYYAGTPQYITITVALACTPVAISGLAVLPDATQGVVYDCTFSLTGTAPFELANVIKPSWMTIDISGSDVVFGGTPPVGGLDEIESVSFDITNCSGNNFVSFAQNITVHATAYTFKIRNMISGWMIQDVVPGFYSQLIGGFPLLAGGELLGNHDEYNDQIGVSLFNIGGPDCSLELVVNNVLIETLTISFTTSTIYYFSARAYLPDDIIVIRLIG